MPHAKIRIAGLLLALVGAALAGCAGTQIPLGSISAPPETARLRIFVQPVSGPAKGTSGRWRTPHEHFEAKTLEKVEGILSRKGIYEVVNAEQRMQVLGNRIIPFEQWTRDDFALARRAGRALWAEYTLLIERGFVGSSPYSRVLMINVETGRRFSVYSSMVQMEDKNTFSRMLKASYREIFRDAKKDLLATAVRKSRAPLPAGAATEKKGPETAGGDNAPATQQPVAESGLGRRIEIETTCAEMETPASGKTQVAVLDFEAPEKQRVVALILAEALREELFRLGTFALVSRESLKETVDEIRMGQAGLVDADQAVQAGRMLAARQIVLGRLSSLETTSILQIKRIDSESQQALALVSQKCGAGREEDLLEEMPQLARRLAQL